MAQWKKILVSGSNAELNQLALSDTLTAQGIVNTSAVSDTRLTGSFSGSFKGDGSQLTGIATVLTISGSSGGDTVNLLTDTLSITGNGISTQVTDNTVTINLPGGTVSSSAQVVSYLDSEDVNLGGISGSSLDVTGNAKIDGNLVLGGNITIGDANTDTVAITADLTTDIRPNADNDVDLGSSGNRFAEIHGVNIYGAINATNAIVSSSVQVDHDSTTGFVSNEHIDHSSVTITAGAGLTGGGDITTTRTLNVASANNGIAVNADSIELDTASSTFTSGVKAKLNADGVISGSSASSAGQGQFTLTVNGANSTVDLGLETSDSPTFSGLTVTNNLTVNGNLDVNGTVTTIDTTNLRVADRFALLASGSTNGDAGFIANTTTDGSGSAFFYDYSANRWALTTSGSVADTANTATPGQYVVSVKRAAGAPSGNPSDFGTDAASRAGMIYVDSSTDEIYIFA